MSVKTVAIETLYEGLYDGPHATPKPSNDGPVFLGIGNITEDGKLDLTDVRHIAEEDFSAWTKRVRPQPGDIVFTYEATLNRYAIIPNGFRGCLGRRTALIRPNTAAVNPRFLFFYFFCEDWRKTIGQNVLSGATVDRIPLTRFPSFPVTVPERCVQDRIADILSAYDDLIENNIRRIKILEDMAQMIYREWFVNFRFPGHDKMRFLESEVGHIPEGWKLSEFGALSMNLDSKRIPLSSMQRASHDRRYPYYGASGIIDQVESYLFDGLHLLISEDGENLRSRKTPIAFLADGKFWVNNHAHIVQGKAPVSTAYLFASMKTADISPYITGTAQPKLSQSNLNRIPVLLPHERVLKAFDDVYLPLLNLIDSLGRKNTNLRNTRDLLLPKLISGELPIDAANEAAAELVEQSA